MPNLIHADKTVAFTVEALSDSQIAGVLSAALTAKFGQGAVLRDVNRAQSSLTYDLYAMSSDGYRDWSSAQLQQVGFTIGDNYAVEFADSTPVMPVTTYEPVGDGVGGTGDGDACFSLVSGDGDEPLRARFSVTSADRYVKDGFAVYPKSLLFRAGDYPDKSFSMSASELEAAAGIINASPDPIAGNVQHTEWLKGKAAFVDKAWTTDGGQVLRGVVRIPLGLDELMSDDEKGISMEWTRAGKLAEGFALCTNPRVTDAALMALAHTQPRALDAPANEAAAASEEDNTVSTVSSASSASTAAKPNFWEQLKAVFTGAGIKIDEPNAPSVSNEDLARRDTATAETMKLRSDLAKATAENFVQAEMRAGRCTPAERDGLQAAFVLAFEDDLRAPTTVSFTAGQGVTKTGNRVDALKARQAQRPAHQLTEELVESAVLLTSDSAADNPQASAQFASLSTTYERRRVAMSGESA